MFRVYQKWNINSIVLPIKIKQEEIERKLILGMTFLGEQFIREARLGGTYKDHTGNLRSSIGYGLYKDGKQIKLVVEQSGNDNDGEGVKTARKLISEKALKKGISLIVVAGMDYAYAVESKGFDVLTIFAPNDNEVGNTLRTLIK